MAERIKCTKLLMVTEIEDHIDDHKVTNQRATKSEISLFDYIEMQYMSKCLQWLIFKFIKLNMINNTIHIV